MTTVAERFLLIVGAVTVSAFIGCGDSSTAVLGEDGQLAALSSPNVLSPPQQVAGPPPTVTPTPLPTLEPTSGTLVYLRGDDLWVASLDGGRSLPPRAVTSGGLRSWYVGNALGTDGRTELFYVLQLTGSRPANGRNVADFAIYRVGLNGGMPEELLRFSGRPPDHALSTPPVSVSPDGRNLAYANEEGLMLRSLSSGDASRLLENGCDEPEFSDTCWAYGPSAWSPDGSVLQVYKGYWEGASTMVVRPFASPLDATETPYSGNAHWSPDGDRLCMREQRYVGSGPVVVYDINTQDALDTSLNIDDLPSAEEGRPLWNARECAWSQQGRLAIRQSETDGTSDLNSVVVFDADLNVVARSKGFEQLFILGEWLPDGSGVLLNRRGPQVEPLGPVIFKPGGGMFELPFDVDFAVGVIP